MIKPTVGRMVWFYEKAAGGGHIGPLAGVVAKVNADATINVCTFNALAYPVPKKNLPLIQDGDLIPASDHCCWMPYQIGQAKKYEALAEERAG